MQVRIKPSRAVGRVQAPPSKSYAHRLLIAAGIFCGGDISNVDFSNDINATLFCLKEMGCVVKTIDNRIVIEPAKEIKGDHFQCGESGSTLRFMIPIVMTRSEKAIFTGSEKLFSRGIEPYLRIFEEKGIKYDLQSDSLKVEGRLKAGRYVLDASSSSQYITGLLFALSTLSEDSEIILTGKFQSRSYVDITIDVLQMVGVEIENRENGFFIRGGQKPNYLVKEVEGDYSNAAFLEALNLFGGDVKITGLNPDSKQGDKAYQIYFPMLQKGNCEIDVSESIDLGPILFTVASYFHGATFKGTSRLRIKESNRIDDMMNTLAKFGAKYEVKEDEVIIFKSQLHPVDEVIDLVNDHRVVMSVIILLTIFGGAINGIEAIKKSFPSFLEVLEHLQVEVKYEIK